MFEAVQGKELGYYVYAHEDHQREALPLIVFLHGAGGRGNGKDELSAVLRNGLPVLLTEKGLHPRCVAVFPQCPTGEYWVGDIPRTLRLIDEVEALYGTDPARVALTGLSMGGFGTWYTATVCPQRFWRIAPVCGGGMPWAAAVLTMPIRAFHGEEDTVVLPSNSIDMMNAIHAFGQNADASLTLYPGVDHSSWVQAYDESLLKFLLGEA
jgi:predicted peptidase